jgi:hypothetical protein
MDAGWVCPLDARTEIFAPGLVLYEMVGYLCRAASAYAWPPSPGPGLCSILFEPVFMM